MDVLLIDDEEFLVDSLCELLTQLPNLRLNYATSVGKATQLCIQFSYDLIISDLKLPDAENDCWLIELAKHNSPQKVIIMSSYEIPGELAKSNHLDIVSYFEKPFDVHKIIEAIEQLNN
ncbi:response regulator [candidate division KSB1 bacterium]|nr:response regulator [candidate division KSB1 bacterium]